MKFSDSKYSLIQVPDDYEYRKNIREYKNFTNCKKHKRKYKIVEDLFYCKKDKRDSCCCYDPAKCHKFYDPILMYDNSMVWRNKFKNIGVHLLFDVTHNIGPICEPFKFTDVQNSPTKMIGKPLFDSLTNTTYMLFKFNNLGPITNDPNFPAILIDMNNTPNYIFSYQVVPENLENGVKVSFYQLGDPYAFDDYKYWLMLDTESHFTTYTKLSHIFEILGVANWICITENVAAMYLTVEAIPTYVVPLCGTRRITSQVDACNEKIIVPVADIEFNNKKLLVNYRNDLLYSVQRMRKYAQENTKGLLLPIIPPQITENSNVLVPTENAIIGRKIGNIESYFTSTVGWYTIFDNATYILGQLQPDSNPTTNIPKEWKQDGFDDSFYGIDISEFTKTNNCYVLFGFKLSYGEYHPSSEITFTPSIQFCEKHLSRSTQSFKINIVNDQGVIGEPVYEIIFDEFTPPGQYFDSFEGKYVLPQGEASFESEVLIPQGQTHFIIFMTTSNLIFTSGISFGPIIISNKFIPYRYIP